MPMAETPGPLECWAIIEDTRDGLRRIHGVYLSPDHAIVDAGALQPQHFVEVVPFQVHRAPQWSSYAEPAWEQADADFDVTVPDASTFDSSAPQA
jgi:hypothetical protein